MAVAKSLRMGFVPKDPVVEAAERGFVARFGSAPTWVALAPGRVNLIGEHTDYNGGFVLPMAIERHTVLAAGLPSAPRAVRTIRIFSDAQSGHAEIRTDIPAQPGAPAWANYVRGVVAGFQRRGFAVPSLDIFATSSVPLGGGLSSSAALEVATATLLEAVAAVQLDPIEKARLCRQAEHEFAGVPCGLMDQLASVLGDTAGALLIDCQSEVARVVPFAEPGVSVLICNTNVKHALGDGEYARRRAECAQAADALGISVLREATLEMVANPKAIRDEVVRARARHIVSENARTLDAVRYLQERNFAAVGALMYESHESLQRDYQVSCAELDALVAAAKVIGRAGGVFGARMTGGGFGGSTVTLVESQRVDAVAREIGASYTRQTGLVMSSFVSAPAQGTHMVDTRGA